MSTFHFGLTGVVATLLLLTGCAPHDAQPLSREAVGARVGEMLYRDGLVAVPEVNARMRTGILAIDRDGASADTVLAAFHQWLDAWTAAHPEEVARARAAVPPGRPGQRDAVPR